MEAPLKVLAAPLLAAAACTSTVLPPPPPADPTTVFVLREALHTGLVLPAVEPDDHSGYVEFGYGDWGWFALGEDSWYQVFATVLWPTRGALGRRELGGHTPAELAARAPWAELQPLVCSAARVAALRRRLQQAVAAGRLAAVVRQDLGFYFVPDERSYWLGENCHDAVADWLEELGADVGWALVRVGLRVAARGTAAPGTAAPAPGAGAAETTPPRGPQRAADGAAVGEPGGRRR